MVISIIYSPHPIPLELSVLFFFFSAVILYLNMYYILHKMDYTHLKINEFTKK